MTPDLHPGMDELIQYCMSSAHATPGTPEDAALADRVRLHLKDCADCRAQAALLCADMTLIAMAVPQVAPPAGAKGAYSRLRAWIWQRRRRGPRPQSSMRMWFR